MIRHVILAGAGALAVLAGGWSARPVASVPTVGEATEQGEPRIVALRRLTEAQYRNAIADIFGPEIKVAGRFEPIVRPAHELMASGAREASVSPAGLEQFDAMARGIAAQVFDTEHRGQFLPCAPKNAAAADDGCARATLAPLGRHLFRRPLARGELEQFVRIARQASEAAGAFSKGLELALASMLVSPRFLYVVETARPGADGALVLDDFSMAQRLSFMLWNSTPNDALLRAAEAGRLSDPAVLARTAEAMVASPRFEQGVRAFFADMLLFEKFDEIAKDPLIYPQFNQNVAQALPEQTLRTITGHLLGRNGDYRALFTTPETWMTRSLGVLYQVPVSRTQGWVPYSFAPEDDRAGLLGQAGFLALYSHSGRSSPTLRGRAIREVLMCQPVPNPPGNVNFTAVQDVTNKATPTARIRLDMHNTDPVCAGCHKITDPAGLALERFDGIGAARRTENGADIDVSGVMDGSSFFGGAGLGKVLASSPDTTLCLASRAFEYATGKPSEDAALIEAINERFAASDYRIRALFVKVATMPEVWRVNAPAQLAKR
jgi:hypothetical protein